MLNMIFSCFLKDRGENNNGKFSLQCGWRNEIKYQEEFFSSELLDFRLCGGEEL